MPKKKQKTYREPTRRQLSHWEKEKRRQRIIFFTGIVIIAAVVFSVLGGWVATQYVPRHEAAIRVNNRVFNMGYYIDMLALLGGSNASSLTQYTVQAIEQNELIRLDSAYLGITVSPDEVNKALEKQSPPLSKKYADVIKAQLLETKMRDEYFDKQVPAAEEQRHVMAMFLESESQADNIKKRLDDGEGFDTLAGEFSLEDTTKSQKGDLGWKPAGVLSLTIGSAKLEQYVFSADAGYVSAPIYDDTMSKHLGYWILKVVERKEETKEAHLYGILLGSEDEAKTVKSRLEAGEDFSALAKELSQHADSKEAGGEMGWVIADSLTKAVASYAFDNTIELGKISDPIKDTDVSTKGGYWLIKVTEISADRPLDTDNRNILKSNLLNNWLDGLLTDPSYTVEDYLTPEKTDFAVQEALKIAAKKKGTQG